MFTHVHTPAHILEHAYPCVHMYRCSMYDHTYEYLSCPGTHVSVCMSVREPHRAPHTTVQASQPPSHQLSSSLRLCAPAPPDVFPISLPLTHLFIQQIQTDTVSLHMQILSSKASGISFPYSQQAWGTRHQSHVHRCTDAHLHAHTDMNIHT